MSNRKKWKIGQQKHDTPIIHPPTYPYAEMAEKASEDDRLWFEQHPGEDTRIRNYVAGEFRDQVPPLDHKVLVRQVEPGVRIRSSIPPAVLALQEQGVHIFLSEEGRVREALKEKGS